MPNDSLSHGQNEEGMWGETGGGGWVIDRKAQVTPDWARWKAGAATGGFYAGRDQAYFCLRNKTLEASKNSNVTLAAIWVKDERGQLKRVIHKA